MTNIELIVGMVLILICIHYALIWGIAYEKRWAFEEQLNTAYKKHKFTGKKLETINLKIKEDLQQVPLPGFFEILPFALFKGCVNIIKSVPCLVKFVISSVKSTRDESKINKISSKKSREIKERKTVSSPSKEPIKNFSLNPKACKGLEDIQVRSEIQTNNWSIEDKQELIILLNKNDNSSSKYENISKVMKKPYDEIIIVAKELLEERKSRLGLSKPERTNFSNFEVNENAACYDSDNDDENLNVSQEKNDNVIIDEVINGENSDNPDANTDTHVSHRRAKLIEDDHANELKDNDKLWSKQEHQKLEAALKIYTKDSTENRWEKIAEYVGSKTKEEIMKRCKLVSMNCKKKNAKIFA